MPDSMGLLPLRRHRVLGPYKQNFPLSVVLPFLLVCRQILHNTHMFQRYEVHVHDTLEWYARCPYTPDSRVALDLYE